MTARSLMLVGLTASALLVAGPGDAAHPDPAVSSQIELGGPVNNQCTPPNPLDPGPLSYWGSLSEKCFTKPPSVGGLELVYAPTRPGNCLGVGDLENGVVRVYGVPGIVYQPFTIQWTHGSGISISAPGCPAS